MGCRRCFCFLTVSIFLSGCALYTPLQAGPLNNRSQHFRAELTRDGWMQDSSGDAYMISRDGFSINYILVKRDKLGRDLAMTKQRFTSGMQPWELAEIHLDILLADRRVTHFQLASNRPQKIDDHPGYCIEYEYTNFKGVGISGVRCGYIHENWIYHIVYEGLTEHYFAENRADFDHFLRTFEGL